MVPEMVSNLFLLMFQWVPITWPWIGILSPVCFHQWQPDNVPRCSLPTSVPSSQHWPPPPLPDRICSYRDIILFTILVRCYSLPIHSNQLLEETTKLWFRLQMQWNVRNKTWLHCPMHDSISLLLPPLSKPQVRNVSQSVGFFLFSFFCSLAGS